MIKVAGLVEDVTFLTDEVLLVTFLTEEVLLVTFLTEVAVLIFNEDALIELWLVALEAIDETLLDAAPPATRVGETLAGR